MDAFFGYLQKSELCYGFFKVYDMRGMNTSVHKNKEMS